MDAQTTTTTSKPRRNWWKLAFFVALIAFELVREVAVLESAEGANPNPSLVVFGGGEVGYRYASASGQWKRTDGGDRLSDNTVAIECREAFGQCIAAHTSVIDEYVYAPDITFHDAEFSDDGVTFVDDDPTCARYTTRIDIKLKQAFSVRERKTTAGDCGKIEERIAMTMGDGFDPAEVEELLDDHFVPLVQLIAAIF